uniref:Serpentine Receptor, class T n=1 Tax=Rhabditophanes sp. KR3021 TaxID=114890 RepID=A0AC35TPZ5_9BILA
MITSELINPDRKHLIIGSIYFTLPLIAFPIYVPFVVAMLHPKNLRLPVYKIMVILSVSDILNLFCAGFFPGYACLNGLDYFNSPTFTITTGASSFALWIVSCFGMCILAFQRCMQMISPHLTHFLFKGNRTWIWLIFPVSLGCSTYFYAPAYMFSTTFKTFVMNPYIGYSYTTPKQFTNYILFVYNSTTIIVLLFVYIGFFVTYITKKKEVGTFNNKSDSTGLRMFFQTFAMCIATFVTAVSFMTETLIEVTEIITVTGHISLILSHAFPAFMFLLFNTTLKGTLKKWLFNKKESTAATINTKVLIRGTNKLSC